MPPEEPIVLDQNLVIGRDCTITFNDKIVTNWDTISVKPLIGKFVKNGADSIREHKRKGRYDATGTISFILGGNNVPSYLPKPGDEITGLKAEVGPDDLDLFAELTDEAKYGKCVVMSTPRELKDEPGTMSCEIEWCFDD